MARRKPVEPPTAPGTDVPAFLAQGPCIEAWGAHPTDMFGAWRAWQDARAEWASERGLIDEDGHLDWHQLPIQLHDRAPYHREKD